MKIGKRLEAHRTLQRRILFKSIASRAAHLGRYREKRRITAGRAAKADRGRLERHKEKFHPVVKIAVEAYAEQMQHLRPSMDLPNNTSGTRPERQTGTASPPRDRCEPVRVGHQYPSIGHRTGDKLLVEAYSKKKKNRNASPGTQGSQQKQKKNMKTKKKHTNYETQTSIDAHHSENRSLDTLILEAYSKKKKNRLLHNMRQVSQQTHNTNYKPMKPTKEHPYRYDI